jgi:hypothetical protein
MDLQLHTGLLRDYDKEYWICILKSCILLCWTLK